MVNTCDNISLNQTTRTTLCPSINFMQNINDINIKPRHLPVSDCNGWFLLIELVRFESRINQVHYLKFLTGVVARSPTAFVACNKPINSLANPSLYSHWHVETQRLCNKRMKPTYFERITFEEKWRIWINTIRFGTFFFLSFFISFFFFFFFFFFFLCDLQSGHLPPGSLYGSLSKNGAIQKGKTKKINCPFFLF